MEFICKDFQPSEHTRQLLETQGKSVGVSVEWEVGNAADGLTASEMQALRRKHNSRNVNYQRAAEVKKLMQQGKKCMEIVTALHRRYRQTMIKRDHAALSDRGGFKKR